ncbi:UDP-N-acetylglucosamine--N-acetylmuramyl-(pentapeptide) pyrophosphoryl-undecaprenol N-acetylglucosamine transferase [Sulfuriferula plumbiphila]|uniref:UDP-N-acetylglucosamine--N-acetylmuramyl-(pentapeptide) pyrophosphoryl-undecaprenol N-acetylglucosamine transferase n=1 Tax=Sulfuriferula plumbiphila TaxID=171865 RepID=A0A512LBI4_9PROT|nr:undecaprenyldiphospho-muramoylpentapeptide beta-N-acetylglucosaminyltransferase [Sulfuriferula plumbiphila]BBP05774.1 UDP-N-acetylglucosamine--N-acetylmuramyl-(pentapeptide) pyrophosphoryl-undecaprenol N-acetylglucosamine transferase [Sulfuriferula plumbiphila]GEP31850.1 UDP-N-acetylglucosamine--N-acetylmuramyl-(pentapeptide) pyrophosphoryl-undecaprenol N-acetylglucosamine transferase [Sulfuriferula plumbiphila]
MSTARTLMVMAGGTGGHIYPGLAAAAALRNHGWNVVWLGTRHGMEARVVPEHGYTMAWLSLGGVRGNGVLRKLLLPVTLLVAFAQALGALLRHRPDVVLGMGGYPSFPGGMMSVLLGKPLVIHEQNSVGGLANRVLACVADRVLTGFPDVFRSRRDKPLPCGKVATTWVGNPVRASIAALPAPQARTAPQLHLLVVGGSLGAAALNDAVPRALALIPEAERPAVIHQSGTRHADSLRANYAAAGVAAEVRDYIADMAEVYAWCDIAVTRAGALTIAELAAAGVPAVLVPYPHAVDDHQTGNAKFMSEAGAALLMPQAELSPARLAGVLRNLDREKLLDMAQHARALARPDATESVARICMELAQ